MTEGGAMTMPGGTQIDDLTAAYWMELETVMNYLAASSNLEGVRGTKSPPC
jgi:hypothetical protein